MSDAYLIPAGCGEAEHTEKKSRFIGQISPAASASEAMAFVDSIRKKHPDATHNVWAYFLRDGGLRFSDDGEPGGTSGLPTLNVLKSAEVFDVCCVVTRYFGGILLGAGGLVRAYSKAASMALAAAGVARMTQWSVLSILCAYPQYERVRRLLDDFGALDTEASFAAEVCVTARIPAETSDAFPPRLADATAGGASCRETARVFKPGPAS
ncbi:MAG: YigZ family protein [Oscillospiraceae bacterium]